MYNCEQKNSLEIITQKNVNINIPRMQFSNLYELLWFVHFKSVIFLTRYENLFS